ncbi:AAA family ATPase [Neptunomonas qingdaonensis]|uniref:Exonuclease SbcC n=1 Tax=Neptunomonas qingdaonensis TaxID=1045558 RepID=A0A1I2TTI6_9GAMM|nr:SMC family ATPase [Neptunomonas qingdaonensis]SFG68232.1 exonuclease SbcC [Neptunomonas qingdaonensis]
MKLQKLEIQAFGPFAGKETINFADLGENPLFLIDGPTGAGKSSILHAICYALYGETTDKERKDLGLRCDHADADTLTELALEFSIRGKTYRIKRIPSQMRPAKKGGGETEEKPSAHLRQVLADGTEETLVAKKVSDADKEIVKTIGLSASQFKQVMVLPQGRFRELLLANSKDRQTILSTLFQTEIFSEIERLLAARASDIDKKHKKFEENKQEALLEVQVTDQAALGEAIIESDGLLGECTRTKVQADQHRLEENNKLKAASDLQLQFAQQKQKQDALNRLVMERDNNEVKRTQYTRAEQATVIAPTWRSVQETGKDIQQKNTDITTAKSAGVEALAKTKAAEQAMTAAGTAYQQRDILKQRETQLDGYRGILSQYEQLQTTDLAAHAKLEQAKTQHAALESALVTKEHEIEQIKLSIEALGQSTAQKAQITEQQLSAKAQLLLRKNLDQANTELQRLQLAEKTAQIAFTDCLVEYQKAEEKADRLELLLRKNQAALLAEKLGEDELCPVCGSADHPQLATRSEDASDIDQDGVDQARSEQSRAATARNEADKQLENNKSAVIAKQTVIVDLVTQLGDDAQRHVSDMEQAHASLISQLDQIDKDEKSLTQRKQDQKTQEAAFKVTTDELAGIQKTLPELHQKKTLAESALKTAEANLPEQYRCTDALEKAIKDTSAEIERLEKAYKAAEAALNAAQLAQANAQAAIKGHGQNLIELNDRLRVRTEEWQQTLDASPFTTQAEFETARLDDALVTRLRQEVSHYDDQRKELTAELGLLAQQLQGKQLPELATLQAQAEATQTAFEAADSAWTEANNRCVLLNRIHERIQQLEADQQQVRQEYEVIGNLAKAASGNGKVRVSLERFVLGNLLDSVLSIASQRLRIMSKGQYSLVRQNEAEQKRNTTAGLDLAIDDAHSGKPRPVATLSGGESFMASLALALGLSDVVQQRSGGIQLDTLFVDEGFGSLDQESLQLAINTLIDLQSTGRTIGIISHVSELKEQMAQRIDVVGSRNGSSIRTVA